MTPRQITIFASKSLSSLETSVPVELQDINNVEPERLGKASSIKKIRCEYANPADHSNKDEALFYKISQEVYQRMFLSTFNNKAFPLNFQKLCDVFNERCLMIRKPGLELLNYLKVTNFKNAVNRYLIYGKSGCGKTLTLQYAVNYAICQGWLVLPNYHMWDWIKFQHPYKEHRKQELIISQYNKERIDQPEMCTRWLEIFRAMNTGLLDKIFTTKKYVWSKHESSEKGITLGNLVDHGIARPRNAADVIGCIMREVRVQDHKLRPPTLIVADCVNAVFGETSLKMIHRPGQPIEPDELTFIYNFKKILSNSWTNGAVVVALNSDFIPNHSKAITKIDDEYPYDMISREGFDVLDPHVPINVPMFSEKEVLSMMAYYIDRKWIGGRCLTEQGEAEIIQLSCHNPRDLVRLCGGLY